MIGPDKSLKLLHLLGFSAGEVAFEHPDGRREWQVDAFRDGHTILARAPTQRHAWALALRLAGRLIRQGVLVTAVAVASLLLVGCGQPPEPPGRTGQGGVEAPAAVQGVAPSRQSAPPDSLATAPAGPRSTTVYVTRTGSRYHREGCRHLSQSKIEVTLEAAVVEYGPCGVCNPPRLPVGESQPNYLIATSPGDAETATAPAAAEAGGYWITTSSGVRHNSGCRYYHNSQGRSCGPNEGRACKICGG